jgi:hypothetical protein
MLGGLAMVRRQLALPGLPQNAAPDRLPRSPCSLPLGFGAGLAAASRGPQPTAAGACGKPASALPTAACFSSPEPEPTATQPSPSFSSTTQPPPCSSTPEPSSSHPPATQPSSSFPAATPSACA